MSALLMEALITSCGRPDLLACTLSSLYFNQQTELFVTIHEDGLSKIGQHKSIEKFIEKTEGKYYLHCEDDWQFENTYDWIKRSIEIMEEDNSIIKVLARHDSPHPCDHDKNGYGILQPWQGADGILWHGFSWNPGITRLDLLKQFITFPKWEQELAEQIYNAGYRVAELSRPIYKHIGYGRSTHE